MLSKLFAPIAPVARAVDAMGPAGAWGLAVVALVLRFYAALPFWKSGLTKWQGEGWFDKITGFELAPSVAFLFEHEYKIRQFGGEISLPFPNLMGLLAALGEVWLPILVFLGLFTRLGALGLFAMAIVIQLVYPNLFFWQHFQWFALLALVLLIGPGRISLDWLLLKGTGGRETQST